MSHVNIPFFVPHLGCPHTCVFCNQRTITGKQDVTLEEFDRTVSQVLSSLSLDPKEKKELQIAFFGGSFTAIEPNLMLALLKKAKAYVDAGKVDSVRLSTRPDAIDRRILSILAEHAVSAVELGIQSTSNSVLNASERGHTAEQAKEACALVKEYDFELVGQMMLGLPGSTLKEELQTAKDLVAWGVDKARIYPTVVFARTALETSMQNGTYTPLTVEDAVERAAQVYEIFCDGGVDVIRIGLCETEGLRSEQTVGGAYHPALGELVINRYYLKKILRASAELSLPDGAALIIETAPNALSKAIGHKKCNLHSLEKIYPNRRILFRVSPFLNEKEVKAIPCNSDGTAVPSEIPSNRADRHG